LLHNDRDFDAFANYLGLRVVPSSGAIMTAGEVLNRG
jgi:hypothetical protein